MKMTVTMPIELAIEAMNEICNDLADHPKMRYQIAAEQAKAALEKLLNPNIVEVVRCKDCKMFHKEDYGEKWCGRFDGGIGSDEDDYCSCGERR